MSSLRSECDAVHGSNRRCRVEARRSVASLGLYYVLQEEGTGAIHQSASGSMPVRQDVPSWMGVRRTVKNPSQGPLPGQPGSADRTPNDKNASQRPHAPPMSPFAPSSNARMPASQQRYPAATSAPFSGRSFSTFRQAPAQPSTGPPQAQPAADSGGHAQQGSQGRIPGGLGHRVVPGAAQSHPTSVEFIDLDSTSGDSEDVSWNEETDAQSQPAPSADGPSSHPTPEPTQHGSAIAADAQDGAEGSHVVSAPLAPAPEPEDMSGYYFPHFTTHFSCPPNAFYIVSLNVDERLQ